MDRSQRADLLDRVAAPNKIGRLLIAPSFREGDFDSHAVDCAFPFSHAGRFWMTYVGWDGRGYRTGLAGSDDLIEWRKEGCSWTGGPPAASPSTTSP